MSINAAIAELEGLKSYLDDDCSTQKALDMAISALEEKEDMLESEDDEKDWSILWSTRKR